MRIFPNRSAPARVAALHITSNMDWRADARRGRKTCSHADASPLDSEDLVPPSMAGSWSVHGSFQDGRLPTGPPGPMKIGASAEKVSSKDSRSATKNCADATFFVGRGSSVSCVTEGGAGFFAGRSAPERSHAAGAPSKCSRAMVGGIEARQPRLDTNLLFQQPGACNSRPEAKTSKL